MRRALMLLLLLPIALAGCGEREERLAVCVRVATALDGPAARAAAVEHEDETTRLTLADGRRVGCRFALPAEFAVPQLVAVAAEGRELSPVQFALLLQAAGLPIPSLLLAETTGPPMPRHPLAYLAQQLVNGLALGAVLGLVAVGYSLVYAVTGTIQFAYGELFMIGAVLFVTLFCALGLAGVALPLLFALAFAAAAAATGLYGWTAERIVYRPLRGRPTLAPLVAAIGLAIALREFVRVAQGSRNLWLGAVLPGGTMLWDGSGFPVLIGHVQALILALALATGLALAWLFGATRLGRSLRACADDPGMAALLGIDVDRTVAGAFALGAAVAALAGGLAAIQYGEADFFMGFLVGFKALTAALLGGFGSITGALLGALLLGLFEALWAGYLGGAWKDAAIFAVLILVLVFRPHGLVGRPPPAARY